MRKYYLYKITSPSGKVYVGQTVRPSVRFSSYKHCKCTGQTLLYNSLVKHGYDSHVIEILLTVICTQEDINMLEILNIGIYKKLNISLNISNGGNLATHRIGLNGKPVMQFSLTGDVIKEYSCIADVGRELSICPEGIAGQCRNRKYYYKGFYWIYKDDYSDNIVFNHGLNKIPIFAFNKNRELIGEFESMSDAGRKFNIDIRDLSHAIRDVTWINKMFFIKTKDFVSVDDIPGFHRGKKVLYIDSNNMEHIFYSLSDCAKYIGIDITSAFYWVKNTRNKVKKYNISYI